MHDLGLAVADTIVGTTLAGLGLATWVKGSRAVGLLMMATAAAWFAGDLGGWTLFLHRGPLVHLLLSYPRGWPRRRLERAVIVIAYVDALVYPLARMDIGTVALAVLVIGTALIGYAGATQRERRDRVPAVVATVGIMLVLGLGAAVRLIGTPADAAALWGYELTVGASAVILFVDLRWSRRGGRGHHGPRCRSR